MAAAAHCSSSSALAPLTPIAPKRTPDLVLIGKPPANATKSLEKAISYGKHYMFENV